VVAVRSRLDNVAEVDWLAGAVAAGAFEALDLMFGGGLVAAVGGFAVHAAEVGPFVGMFIDESDLHVVMVTGG